MAFKKQDPSDETMRFQAELSGNAKEVVEEKIKEHQEKYGEGAQLGKNRVVQILLCELYFIKHQKR